MPARTFKFQGKAFSTNGNVTVTATFGGAEIYTGTVPTTNSPTPSRNTELLEDLFQYVGTTDISGNIAFSLSVTGGDVYFGLPMANYSGFLADGINTDTDPATWGPIIIPPEDFWEDVNINTVESDGKTNVLVDGAIKQRQVMGDEELGDWQYRISDGSTLTCEIFVDPNIITPSVPPNPTKPDVPPL